MNEAQKQGRDIIDRALVEATQFLHPVADDSDERDPPEDANWMVHGWVIAIDFAVINPEDDELEVWTVVGRSKDLPRTQAVGLGDTIITTNQ